MNFFFAKFFVGRKRLQCANLAQNNFHLIFIAVSTLFSLRERIAIVEFFRNACEKFFWKRKFVSKSFQIVYACISFLVRSLIFFAQCDDYRVAYFSFAFLVRRSVDDLAVEEHRRRSAAIEIHRIDRA